LGKYSESSSSVAERDALRKMVLLRWGVGAVGASSVPGGVVGGARFGVLRLGEGRVVTVMASCMFGRYLVPWQIRLTCGS
jgi:hypothetical protein